MTTTVSDAQDTEKAIADLKARAAGKVSSLVANNPDEPALPAARAEVEAEIKAELMKDISLAELRELVQFVRSGGLKQQTTSRDAPDSFDEYGRNFRRMVHLMDVTGAAGDVRRIERPMALSLLEARKDNADFFDINEQTWILRGVKRQKDRPENTVGYEGGVPV